MRKVASGQESGCYSNTGEVHVNAQLAISWFGWAWCEPVIFTRETRTQSRETVSYQVSTKGAMREIDNINTVFRTYRWPPRSSSHANPPKVDTEALAKVNWFTADFRFEKRVLQNKAIITTQRIQLYFDIYNFLKPKKWESIYAMLNIFCENDVCYF